MVTSFHFLLTGALLAMATAAEPHLEKIDLFQAGVDGYALYRIPGIVVTAKGTLLAYCEARKTGRGDWGTIDVMLRRSTDGGRTWEPRRQIAHFGPAVPKNPVALQQKLAAEGETTVNNPVAIVDRQTGAIHFLYCVEYARCFYMRSDDDGLSFSRPVDITAAFEAFRADYDWRVIATGPGHGIQLDNGRLVVAVWMSPGTGGHAHRPSVNSVIYSDDHGRTWQRGQIAVPDTPRFVFPNETVLVQLADGRVMLNVRSESADHRRLVTISKDGATGWSAPEFHPQLLEPICMASMVRLSRQPPDDRNRLLFANPHNLDRADGKAKPGGSRDRRNLSVKLSYDEGKTWPIDKVLEPGYSAYSDLAVGPDGTIYCFYERGKEDPTQKRPTSYAYLTLARFNRAWLVGQEEPAAQSADGHRPPAIIPLDISAQTERHVIIAQGTETLYQGHPTTLLLPDGKTMFCVWTIGHGGPCGPMKRSDDGGRTWSPLLDVPEDWKTVRNCPAIYRLSDPQGKARLLVFAGQGPDGSMHQSCSEDDGRTWSPMRSNGLKCVMPFCTIAPIEGGKRLLGMTNIRRPGETKEAKSNVVAQSFSADGGRTWSPWQVVLDLPGYKPCEPALVRSPDGRQLLCLMRENAKSESLWMTSDDEGRTWSPHKRLPPGLVGDRHMPCYAPDGRLVVCFRDKSKTLGTFGHFVAWVGRYADIVEGRDGVAQRDGQYRVKLLHSHAGGDCGYPGLERLPDGTLVATTYVKYRPGKEKHSVVSGRFKLDELDRLAAQRER